jgi:hypothetical protein
LSTRSGKSRSRDTRSPNAETFDAGHEGKKLIPGPASQEKEEFQGACLRPPEGGLGTLRMGTSWVLLDSAISCGSSVTICSPKTDSCTGRGNCPKSGSPRRSMGDQPAATPPATIPAMTVAAPRALFDLERVLLLRLRESGVGAGEWLRLLKLSSRVGV